MYRIPDGVRSTQNIDGGVVLDVERGNLLRLNRTGALIFEWLREGRNESQIAERMSNDFEISREMAERDLGEFLELLKRQHLLL